MREFPFVRNGKTLLSGIDPVRRAELTADAVSVTDKTLYICPSPLYGYGLARLLARLETEAPDSAVLCVEADPELYDLTRKHIDPALEADKKLRVTNIHEAGNLCAFVREIWGGRAFRRLDTVRFSGGWQLFPELYDSLCGALRREIATDWSNALTLTRMGRLYIRNALRNLALIPGFSSIADLSFGEDPVLVLGAGPSLDETLYAFKDRFSEIFRLPESRPFRIICVDTCIGSLKDRGIVPDLVVILESQHWNLRDFIGCRNWEVPFAIDLSALPETAGILSGKGYLFMTPWTNLAFFERLKTAGLLPVVVPPLGSVGLTAVELARRLTCGKIICAGLDFSFTADKYHALGTPGHRDALNSQTRLRGLINSAAYEVSAAAVSKSGSSVRTNPGMRNYRNLFEQEFASDTRLFEIVGSGLSLGLESLLLDDALSVLSGGINSELLTQRHGGAEALRVEDARKEKLLLFLGGEKKRLTELRDILTGKAAGKQSLLGTLIDECDYLWAHFPDLAGGQFRAKGSDITDISFLKRLRMEIDPALVLLDKTLLE